jgi:5'-nucleotidase
MPPDVDLLKLDVPTAATPETPWEITRISRQRYYVPVATKRSSWDVPGNVDYREGAILEGEDQDSDVYVLRVKQHVSVTPLSMDFTSRVDFDGLNRLLRDGVTAE